MTTKKTTELIKMDVEHYKKLIVKVGESRNRFFTNNNFDDVPPDSIRVMVRDIRQNLYEMLISLYKDQIKYYEDILSELESKKKQKT